MGFIEDVSINEGHGPFIKDSFTNGEMLSVAGRGARDLEFLFLYKRRARDLGLVRCLWKLPLQTKTNGSGSPFMTSSFITEEKESEAASPFTGVLYKQGTRVYRDSFTNKGQGT